LIAAVVLAAIPAVVVGAALLYLKFGDLSRHRGTVERLVSDALGRELVIAGEFAPEVGLTTRLVAGEVTLANPAGWSGEPHMVSVGRLVAEVELLPLLSGRFRIHDVTIEGARVLLESDGAGRANWQFKTGDKAAAVPSVERRAPPEISVQSVRLRDAVAVYWDPSLGRALELTVSALNVVSDESGMLELRLDGGLNGTSLGLGGRAGPLAGFLSAGAVEHDLAGHLGDVTIALEGRIGRLGGLDGVDADIKVEGPDLATVGEPFGLAGLPSDPFRVAATVSPTAAGTALSVDATLDDMTVQVGGTVDSLLAPVDLDLTLSASGPDVARVGAITGLEGLPHDPFTVSGRMHWQGFPITFEGFEARVGDNTLALEGVLGAPPRLLDTDFRIEAAGPNIAALAALVGVNLPGQEFEIDGRLVRVEEGIRVEGVVARIGETTLDADGTIGDPPGFAGTELTVSAKGPDISSFGGLLGVDLPAEPFEVSGRLTPDGDTITLDGIQAGLGGNSLSVEGRIAATSGFIGTDLSVHAEGHDLVWLEQLTGLSDLPREPYRLDGGLRVVRGGYHLEGVHGELVGASLDIDGLIGGVSGLAGTEVTIRTNGHDLSRLASLAGLENIPHEPFDIRSAVRIAGGGYELEGFAAKVGDLELRLEGRIGSLPGLHGTALTLAARAPHLSMLQPLVEEIQLPSAPISVTGGLRVEPEGYLLERMVAELDGHRVEADGLLRVAPGFIGSELTVSIAGSDLDHFGRLVADAGLTELPELPIEPYSATGRLAIDEDGYRLDKVRASLGSATAHVDGRVGPPPTLLGTDLTLSVDGPNASLFSAVTGVTIPVAPFRVRGQLERQQSGFRFHDLSIRLGEYNLTADGMLGGLPTLIDTDLEVQARGPSLKLIEQLGGPSGIPDQPFELDAHLHGDTHRFKSDRFVVRIGASDVHGSFRLDLTARPSLQATLSSSRIDLTRYLSERAERKRAAAEGKQRPPPTKRDRVIPDTPLELELIRSADADVVWTVDELVLPADRFNDVVIDLTLEDGRLQLGPLDAAGSAGGRLNANLALEPVTGGAYSVRVNVDVKNGRLSPSRSNDDPSGRPSVDLVIELDSAGTSAREIAASLNGAITLVLGEGQVDRSVIDLVTADILITLLETLNPFAKEQATTTLECAVVVTKFDGGIATLEPMAVQTESVTMVGEGRIDLSTEKLELEWVTKPRKGFGLSASTLTNPYIKLGGTLAKPALEMKPLEAVTSTGVAVATGGLSILGKGLLDRITAERKVCQQAIRRAEESASLRSSSR
jgi:uncharacterized protein involved in outer membrane biogenesis